MAGSRFIRTVTYGGYDKSDVIRRLDSLYEEIFGLQNELRETKLLLDGSKDGKEIKEALEGVLADLGEHLAQQSGALFGFTRAGRVVVVHRLEIACLLVHDRRVGRVIDAPALHACARFLGGHGKAVFGRDRRCGGHSNFGGRDIGSLFGVGLLCRLAGGGAFGCLLLFALAHPFLEGGLARLGFFRCRAVMLVGMVGSFGG